MQKQAHSPIRLGDIPRRVTNAITQTLKQYCVLLLGLDVKKGVETIFFCGSGTLVTAGKGHYILTAAHVWTGLRDFPMVGLTLTEYESRFAIRSDAVVATMLWKGKPSPWGPDLAFLELPAIALGRIKAHKTFFNLSKRQDMALEASPVVEVGLWAVVGAPAETSVLSPQRAELRGGAYFSGVDKVYQRTEYDYLDVAVDLSGASESPSSCEGLSGGGLWHIPLGRSIDHSGRRWRWTHFLEGVAFYQSTVRSHRRHIRCHGRRTIYGRGLEAICVA